YILGALTVAAPIVFHLIRRLPKGEVPFGSLMFLSPTPPRLNRRSRLDNLLLLVLRAAALCLLALAFARPFLRQPARPDPGDVERRRVAVVIDTSASLRRGDLWPKAQALAAEAIAGCRPGDQLAVFAFGASTLPLLGFEESKTLDPARRRAVAGALVRRLSPSWHPTDLGQALVDAVAAVEDVTDPTEKSGRVPRRVVLISDLQQGSRLDALGDFEWPSDVELELRTVSDTRPNVGLQWLTDATETPAAGAPLRVRVSSDPGSRQELFTLAWVDDKGRDTGKPVAVYVPPGESRVVSVPQANDASSLRLSGDAHAFDNTLFLAPERKDVATVVYLGTDAADDPAGMLYYLNRVFEDSTRRGVTIVSRSPAAELTLEKARSTPLVVLTSETTPANSARLRTYALGGGTVLAVVAAPGRAAAIAAVADVAPWDAAEAAVGRDTLLGEIAFEHPMFAPLAGAQFNDFTKIHFWKYRRIPDKALGDARVLARFEGGDAAVVEKPVGKGRLVVLASGWGPADSQLARSSKFVPLMSALLDGRDPQPADTGGHRVGDRVALPGGDEADKGRVVRKPDGATVEVPAGDGFFGETDQPGVYTVDTPEGPRAFAVNLDPSEGKTTPMHVETLEQFGCRVASRTPKAADPEHRRQLQNVELEGRQKLWRWLTLSAIGVLIVETWLAGRLSRT
ncbi:MAG: BatA domain-containing protein, partial [Planctomycetia bacterium]|nr:BatA domain-containing protein [Planctomycetia bacterium]